MIIDETTTWATFSAFHCPTTSSRFVFIYSDESFPRHNEERRNKKKTFFFLLRQPMKWALRRRVDGGRWMRKNRNLGRSRLFFLRDSSKSIGRIVSFMLNSKRDWRIFHEQVNHEVESSATQKMPLLRLMHRILTFHWIMSKPMSFLIKFKTSCFETSLNIVSLISQCCRNKKPTRVNELRLARLLFLRNCPASRFSRFFLIAMRCV